MTVHPLQLLLEPERIPLLPSKKQDGRCWSRIKDAFQVSRRYSVVAAQIAVLALDTLFLIAKADKNAPEQMGEIALALLSTIGILSLHYSIDMAWKSLQDTRFALKVENRTIAALSAAKTAQTASDALLMLGNFYAAMQGVSGHPAEQTAAYSRMILWGEISLGAGLGITLLSLFITYRTGKQLKEELTDPAAAASIRFCMDKDTLWHLIEKLKNLKKEDQETLQAALDVVKENIDTQLKVTMSGQIVLVIAGDILQAIEKAYTPNSLVSAVISFSVASAYTVRMCIEKGLEYCQREKLDASFSSGSNRNA